VRKSIALLFIEHFEVPYIWTHKRDYLNLFDAEQPTYRVEFLHRADLWRIYDLGRKFQALVERRKVLESSYEKIRETNLYYESKIRDELDSVESVADAATWLGIVYRKQRKDQSDFHFHDDEESEIKKKKLPNRISGYEIVKNTIISKLAEVRCIK
jgi:transcription elongation factor SPT6